MRANSIIMLVLALVFGVIAVFLVQSWLQGQVSLAGRQPAAALPAPTETIVVAARPLRFGAVLRADSLKEIPWPSGSAPEGSFKKISELTGEDGERAVLSAIEVNEPVLAQKITGAGQRATLSARVDKGMRAVSIRINDVLGVAGFVLPGDRVDVMLTRTTKDGRVTDILLQNVKVLAIDQVADDRKNDAQVSSTATFEVDTVDAQKLALATGVGTLSLALRAAGSVDAAQPRRVTLGDLNPAAEIYAEDTEGGDGVKLPAVIDERFKAVENQIKTVSDLILQANKRKIGSDGELNRPTKPLIDPNARVGIIRGIEREEYSVPRDDAR